MCRITVQRIKKMIKFLKSPANANPASREFTTLDFTENHNNNNNKKKKLKKKMNT